jgi:hypothetical protein
MEQARIEVSEESLGRSAAGLVYGKLLLHVDGISFPHTEWTDFVVVVLAWWCRAALRLLQGEHGPIEVRFMEGPFLTELRSTPTQRWHVSLVEAGLKRHVRHSANVEAESLVRSLLVASEKILEACQVRDWWTPDANDLASTVEDLRKQTKHLTH